MNAPHQIDFLSLDVEGAEEFVMRGFPFKDYGVSLINIESASPSLQTLLVSNGFKMIARLGKEDTLWAHESVKAELNPPQLSKYRSSLRSSDPKF